MSADKTDKLNES